MASIQMLKICDESIYKSIGIIFPSCVKKGKLFSEWKNAIAVCVFKKSNKQELKNCRPISLLPVLRKIFGKLLYASFFIGFSSRIV